MTPACFLTEDTVYRRGWHCRLSLFLFASHLSLLTPPQPISLNHAGLEEEQTLLLILSCHYSLVLNTADAGFQQRTWLIRTSINTANYSLMPLTGSQFSQWCSPVPQLIDVLPSLPLLQAASWQSASRLHRCNRNNYGSIAIITFLCCTPVGITRAINRNDDSSTRLKMACDRVWVEPSQQIICLCFVLFLLLSCVVRWQP